MKKNLLFYLFVMGLVLIPLTGFAQENDSILKKEFTLNQAIEYALIHNKKIKNASLTIQTAEKQKWETIATGLPQVDAKIEYQRWFRQQFPGVDFNQDGVVDFGAKQNITPSITLSQLIFDGSYIVAVQSTKVFLEISKNAKTKTDIEIKKAVIAAYSNVLLTKESISILEQNLSTLTKNVNETKALLDNGMVEEEDLEQLQLTRNSIENNLNNLYKLSTISKNYLKLLMGYKINNNLYVVDNLDTLSSHAVLEKDTSFSVTNNIDYKIAKNDSASKQLLYKLEIARRLPSIGAFVSGNYIGNSNTFSFFKKDQKWVPTALGGITINIPVFSSFRSAARIKRAKLEWEISENELENKKEEILIQIQATNSELNLALETLANKKKNLNLAERIERKNNLKYSEGIASSFELRQAQMQLYSTQQEYLKAMVEVINKKAELDSLTK